MSLNILEQAGMLSGKGGHLNQISFDEMVSDGEDPKDAAESLVMLNQADMLSGRTGLVNRTALQQATKSGVIKSNENGVNLRDAVGALIKLQQEGMLQGGSLDRVGLIAMHLVGMLSGVDRILNRDCFAQLVTVNRGVNTRSTFVADGLIEMHSAGMLSGNEGRLNRDRFTSMVSAGTNPYDAAKNLVEEEMKKRRATVHVLAQATRNKRDQKGGIPKLPVDLLGKISACLFNSAITEKNLTNKIADINNSIKKNRASFSR